MRLEHTYSNDAVISFKFQFHKGAIRTASDFVIPEMDSIFQFHKGAIRTLAPQRAFHSNFYFNSIKVRLEL